MKKVTILTVGDWRAWQFGYEIDDWYVLRINEDKVQICIKGWCVSDAIWVNKETFLKESEPLGRGVFRWWWHLLPWKDLVMPFSAYT